MVPQYRGVLASQAWGKAGIGTTGPNLSRTQYALILRAAPVKSILATPIWARENPLISL